MVLGVVALAAVVGRGDVAVDLQATVNKIHVLIKKHRIQGIILQQNRINSGTESERNQASEPTTSLEGFLTVFCLNENEHSIL